MTEAPQKESDRIGNAPHPRFSDALYGQEQAEADFLESFNSGRLLHAWLIAGPSGIGKATLAWRIAKFLLADPAPNASSLDVPRNHPTLSRIHSLADTSIYLLRRPTDSKSGQLKKGISVDEVRNLKSYFGYTASDNRYRVAIIDSADELNEHAANALLKLLEEPPQKTVIILVSHTPSMLLPTIRSRCAVLRCKPLGKSDFSRALENLDIGVRNRHRVLVELAEGSVGEAVRIVDGDGLEIYSNLVGLFSKSPGFQRGEATRIADRCSSPESYKLTARLISIFLRRLALAGLGRNSEVEAVEGEKILFQKLAPGPAASREWADSFFNLSRRAETAIQVNVDPYTTVLELLLAIDRKAGKLTGSRI